MKHLQTHKPEIYNNYINVSLRAILDGRKEILYFRQTLWQ